MKNGFYVIYCSKNKGKDKCLINLFVFFNFLLVDNYYLQVGFNYLYIYKIDGKIFFFIKINDKSLVQKINRFKVLVEDIKNSFVDDELLGFLFFLFVEGDIIGFVRIVFGSIIFDLIDFLIGKGMLLSSGECVQIELLMRGIIKDDVMYMYFIGRITVKVEVKLFVFGDILKVLGVIDIEGEFFDLLDIVIKLKFKRDIKKVVKDIIFNSLF